MREFLAFSVIAFWLSFGFAVMFLSPQLNPNLEINLNVSQNPITFIFENGLLFIKCMFLVIPNIPYYLTILVTLLQVLSYVIVIFLFRS